MSDVLTQIIPEGSHWGVGCNIINKEGKILLLQRSDNQQWGTPGGTVDPGETVVDAVYRETLEESGLQLVDPKYIGMNYTQTVKNGEKIIWNSYCFVATEFIGEVKIQEDEVLDYKWVGIDDLKNYELFLPCLYSLDMMIQYPELFKLFSPAGEPIIKMTALEQLTSIHNPGTNGGNGHIDPNSGNFVYDKPGKKTQTASQPKVLPKGNNSSTSSQINELKNSYINYYSKKGSQIKKLYQVKDGQFVFPDYNTLAKDGIVKDKTSYFTLFKEQFVLFKLFNEK
jgi:ADP-ribose pyrophosphatase